MVDRDIFPGDQSLPDGERIQSRKDRLIRADGYLVPLRKVSPKGEKMYAQIRRIPVPSTQARFASENFTQRVDSLVLMDIFVGDIEIPGGLRPIAHRDWYTKDDVANSGGSLRGVEYPTTEWDMRAREKWKDRVAVVVDPDYRGNDIAQFMTAISLLALERMGIKTIQTGILVRIEAEAVWRKFGVEGMRATPIEQTTSHPNINIVISEFL